MSLHAFLDEYPGPDPGKTLRAALDEGAALDEEAALDEAVDLNGVAGPMGETLLHVATRRRRLAAVKILMDHGADLDAKNAGGKTPFAHAIRRGFFEISGALARRGANTELTKADELAVAFSGGKIQEAKRILDENPLLARTGNAEEDRLLADMAGRGEPEPVLMLIKAGADLAAPGLDQGTPLHQAAWFGQPENARLLVEAGAPLDVFEGTHGSSPLGWAVHGSRYSGGAEERQDLYVELVELLLEAGSSLSYPDETEGGEYLQRLFRDASPRVEALLNAWDPGSD